MVGKPAKMKMSDVIKMVGGVTRGTRQPVSQVKIDADGNLCMIMVVPGDDPIGPPTQTEVEAERSAWDEAVQGIDTEPGLGNK